MHPNPLFRSSDRARFEKLISDAGFGIVFLTTPSGPRAAHVPILSDGEGHIRFHLARSNMMTRHLGGARALINVSGPDGYISPRWYDNRDTVPTWDYVALEMEGPVRGLTDQELEQLLHDVIATFEDRIAGEKWRASECSEKVWAGLFKGIAGFSMQVEDWRPTFKLSQKKSEPERSRIAQGVEDQGNAALSQWMREIAQ